MSSIRFFLCVSTIGSFVTLFAANASAQLIDDNRSHFRPGERFRFKALYKYDAAGRLNEETHLTKDEVLVNRIVYKYSATGKPAGYSVFDGSDKLVSGMATPAPATSPKSRNALGR